MAQQNHYICSNFSRSWSEILPPVFRYLHSSWYCFCFSLIEGSVWHSWGKLGCCQYSSSQKVFVLCRSIFGLPGTPREVQVPQGCLQYCFCWVSLWFGSSPSLQVLWAWQWHCDLLIPQLQTVLLVPWGSVLSKMQSSAFRYRVRNEVYRRC